MGPTRPALLGYVLMMFWATVAHAETRGGRFALNTLEPTPTGDAFVAVPSPRIGGHLILRGAIVADYASRPLTIGDGATAIVSDQVFVRADVTLALANRFLFSAHVPYAVSQYGEAPNVTNMDPLALRPRALGDVRLGVRARILGNDDQSRFQLGLAVHALLPTATADAFVGEGSLRMDAQALAGGYLALRFPVQWSASVGTMLRTPDNPIPSSFRFGAGIAALFADEQVSLGLQTFGTSFFRKTTLIDATYSDIMANPHPGLEILGEARVFLFKGLTFAVAAGPGLMAAAGTPSFRGIALVAWAPRTSVRKRNPSTSSAHQQPRDRDNDGIIDDVDACPEEPGIATDDPERNGCPSADRDGDHILDVDDACPFVIGVKQDMTEKNGCPVDSDGDGVPDADDGCPQDPGYAQEKKKGCPADEDDDGVFDTIDACPHQKGIFASEPWQRGCPEDLDGDGVAFPTDLCPLDRGTARSSEPGCPQYVRLEGDKIVLKRRVFVVPASPQNIVARESLPVLEEIRNLCQDHPKILKVEIQAHTHDSGDLKKKLAATQADAEVVLRTLVTLGVSSEKLVAKGYGYKKPVADNRSAEGRKANHRIVFEVLEWAK